MIFVFHGEDAFQSTQKVNQIKEKFKKEVDASGMNIEVLDGEKLKSEEFLKVAFATGFLVSKRLVIVKNLGTKNKDKKTQESIRDAIFSTKTENIIVFHETDTIKTDKRKRKEKTLQEVLLSQKYVQEFSHLNTQALENWIKTFLAGEEIQISQDALRLLTAFIGSDLYQMTQVLEVLTSYVKGQERKTIEISDINLHAKSNVDANVFALTDAMGKSQSKQALSELMNQFRSGAHELYVLTMLIRQIKILLEVKSHFTHQAYSPQGAKALSYHPFVVKKAYVQSQGYALPELKQMYKQLLEIEWQAKTGQGDPKTRLCSFVVKK